MTRRETISRSAMLTQLGACASQCGLRVFVKAKRVYVRAANAYQMRETFTFVRGTATAHESVGLKNAHRWIMRQAGGLKQNPVKTFYVSEVSHYGQIVPFSQRVTNNLKDARGIAAMLENAIIEKPGREFEFYGLGKNFEGSPGFGAKKNPVPPSSKSLTTQLKRAQNLYKRFSGHDAEHAERVTVPDYPDAVLNIGKVAGILYDTMRDGKKEKYIHRFHASSRPLFCVSPDGLQLFMIGGSYDFTERGIVDTFPGSGKPRE